MVASATELNPKALRIGNVEADEAFVIGDSDDEGVVESSAPPAYMPSDDATTCSATPDVEMTEGVAKTPEPDRTGFNTEYWIKPGDTLIGIALKYGIDVSAIYRLC